MKTISNKAFISGAICVGLCLSGCTAVSVKPVERNAHNVQALCIEENLAVNKSGFLPMLENNLATHSIASKRYSGFAPNDCQYTLHYTAHWAWDLAVYLRDAEVYVREGNQTIGSGIYHLRGGGGLSLAKFASAESKMTPVLDKVFEQFPKVADGKQSQLSSASSQQVTSDK